MSSTDQSKSPNGRFVERLLGAAGGAILAGTLGVWIFGLFREVIPNEVIAVIAGVAGGAVAVIQKHWAERKERGEKE